MCNYDSSVFILDKSYEPSSQEGGDCNTIYEFRIIQKNNSMIEFIEKGPYNTYITTYLYDCNLNTIKINKEFWL